MAEKKSEVKVEVVKETPAPSAGPVAAPAKNNNKTIIIVVVVIVAIVGLICAACVAFPSILVSIGLQKAAEVTNNLNDIGWNVDSNADSTTDSNSNTNTGSGTTTTTPAELAEDMANCKTGCDFLSGSKDSSGCVSLCEAGVYAEAGMCDKVEAGLLRSGCWMSKAEKAKDASVCENLDAGIYRDTCYSSVRKQRKMYQFVTR